MIVRLHLPHGSSAKVLWMDGAFINLKADVQYCRKAHAFSVSVVPKADTLGTFTAKPASVIAMVFVTDKGKLKLANNLPPKGQ